MLSQHESETGQTVQSACRSELSAQLSRDLDQSHSTALTRFKDGETSGGLVAIWLYLATFLRKGIVEALFLKGRVGFVASSVAAQDAYNQSAMLHCMSVQEK